MQMLAQAGTPSGPNDTFIAAHALALGSENIYGNSHCCFPNLRGPKQNGRAFMPGRFIRFSYCFVTSCVSKFNIYESDPTVIGTFTVPLNVTTTRRVLCTVFVTVDVSDDVSDFTRVRVMS
jgi:hypothetical protein